MQLLFALYLRSLCVGKVSPPPPVKIDVTTTTDKPFSLRRVVGMPLGHYINWARLHYVHCGCHALAIMRINDSKIGGTTLTTKSETPKSLEWGFLFVVCNPNIPSVHIVAGRECSLRDKGKQGSV